MVAFSTPPRCPECFKCKEKPGIFLMSDKELTEGVMYYWCRDCYWKAFKEERKKGKKK